MNITPTVKTILETAPAKAFATTCPDDINVVPVSMIKVNESSIWLFDFFMNKTAQNACASSACALTAWEDMKGIQIKGDVTYVTGGESFDEAVDWVQIQNPDRVVKGLLIIDPTAMFDISPGGAYTAEELGIK
jgi:predicted pyridoxine 5'-phosphate oxidase superfamily flavin-nucleotide-binding protein